MSKSGNTSPAAAGVGFAPQPTTELALFELCGPVEFPSTPGEAAVCDNARQVWHAAGGYGGTGLGRRERLYFPAVRHDVAGAAVGNLPLGMGSRCHAWFNRQSGRWEAITPAATLCRFEMTELLACGGAAQAKAFFYALDGTRLDAAAPAETITAWDRQGQFSKMATAAGDAGAMGVAALMADAGCWEIIAMQTPGDFWGTLAGDLRFDQESQTVEAAGGAMGGYNVFGVNHGPLITAWNPRAKEMPFWHAGRSGDRVYCRWDIRAARYWILAVEPSAAAWQELDVVVRTSLSIDFTSQTFTHRDFTRRIRIPPWAEIGPEQ